MEMIFKICTLDVWDAAKAAGCFSGAGIDLEDGYIHFSDVGQVRDTADLHFTGQKNLVLIAVDADLLGPRLKWESSRGGASFPHLYDVLDLSQTAWIKPLPVGADGRHEFPEMIP